MKMDNESGVAFTFVMIVILFFVAAIVWAFLMVGINPLVLVHNGYVAQGKVSVQSHYLATTSIAYLLGIPGITAIGLWIYSINRANEAAQAGSLWG